MAHVSFFFYHVNVDPESGSKNQPDGPLAGWILCQVQERKMNQGGMFLLVSSEILHVFFVEYLENKLLLISINFTPKTSHSCLKKWYTRFSR